MQTKTRSIVLFAILALLFGGMAHAQSFSVNPNPSDGQVLPPNGEGDGGGCGTITVSQSSSTTPVAQNSVSCNNASGHADNSYFRAFDLAGEFGITGDFEVCEVDVAVESATGPDQTVTINLYAGPVGFPTGFPGSFTQIGTADTTVAAQALTNITVPVTGIVPAGQQLIVEVFTPNGQATGNFFFIGSNNLGESGPSYLAAADCGITDPTTTGAIGFANMQIILEASGNTAAPGVSPIEVPTASQYGLAGLIAFLAILGAVAIRRRLA